MTERVFRPRRVSRRTFLAGTAATALTLAACTRNTTVLVPNGRIDAVEAARPHTGRTVAVELTAGRTQIDLGDTRAATFAYGDAVPGPLIRANVGDELVVTLKNRLDHSTSVHWHGIALRNDMDGVAPASPDIESGTDFVYRFSVPHSGTYWAHPHTGLDADTGLYLPIIVDDPAEPGAYDAEWVVVLDDWTDGVGSTPQQLYDGLRRSSMPAHDDMPGMGGMHDTGSMPGMNGIGRSALLGGDAGDISYPYYVINGRIPAAATTFNAKPGNRVRIRIVNAGSDTAFRVALASHRMTVTHTDGFPVRPTDVDALLVGMGERYDVVVTAGDGVFPLVAAAEGKEGLALALLSTGAGTAPDPAYRPPEFDGLVGTVEMFTATSEVDLGSAEPDTRLSAGLSGDMMKYEWMINGRPFSHTEPLTVRQGQRATLTFNNMSMMWHPMHLHGHTFQVINPDGGRGARKDTVVVLPMQQLTVDVIADNPGEWMLHCHNTYHQEAGMMTTLDYVM
ncbi:multicopper oxidase family protein [Mycobacterium barrassiae]|uniref:multicopper oxidase family protein n=1 Tax=Mycobacterium barrassiae TaxID=319709 RepID=UPI0027E29EB6|nr:multicopper oxidase family protein [Mycobacterium barrassiae]